MGLLDIIPAMEGIRPPPPKEGQLGLAGRAGVGLVGAEFAGQAPLDSTAGTAGGAIVPPWALKWQSEPTHHVFLSQMSQLHAAYLQSPPPPVEGSQGRR